MACGIKYHIKNTTPPQPLSLQECVSTHHTTTPPFGRHLTGSHHHPSPNRPSKPCAPMVSPSTQPPTNPFPIAALIHFKHQTPLTHTTLFPRLSLSQPRPPSPPPPNSLHSKHLRKIQQPAPLLPLLTTTTTTGEKHRRIRKAEEDVEALSFFSLLYSVRRVLFITLDLLLLRNPNTISLTSPLLHVLVIASRLTHGEPSQPPHHHQHHSSPSSLLFLRRLLHLLPLFQSSRLVQI